MENRPQWDLNLITQNMLKKPHANSRVLEKHGELHTKKIARLTNMSSSTAAKYLMGLEKAGKISLREEKPYKKWRVLSKGAKDSASYEET